MSCELTNVYDICIFQNATFGFNFRLLDDTSSGSINATSWSFTGSIKEAYTDLTPLMYFTMSVESYTTASINARLGAADTWRLTGSKYVYDILAYNPTVTPPEEYRLIQGKVTIKPGVTMP